MIPLKDNIKSSRFPWMTVFLILANIYGFYLELTAPSLDRFLFRYALIPQLVDLHNPFTWYRFMTALFLHGGFFHIASNMLFLWVFGDNIEDRFGWLYLPLYIIGGIIGGLAQYYFMPHSPLPIIGASGAIATVLGAYFVLYPTSRISTLIFIFFFVTIVQVPAMAILAYWFLLQLFNGVTSIAATAADAGGVAYYAHIAGFIAGVIFAYSAGKRQAQITYEA